MLYDNVDRFNSMSFIDSCIEMSFMIDDVKKKYLQIFNLKSILELNVFFALIEVDSHTVCAKKMVNVGAWRCDDCAKSDSIIFCQDCWSGMRDKHKNHNVVFLHQVNSGTCDCGDHNCIDKQYFCPKHKGTIEKREEINAYINKVLGEELAFKFRSLSEKFFNNMSYYIMKAINDKKTKTDDFIKVVDGFVNTFGLLCEISSACNFIMCDLLLKKYSYKTKHTCIDIEGNEAKMTKQSFFSHDCTCPFIRYLLEFWPGKKQKLLYKLIHNYKLKKYIGLYYFLFYNDFFKRFIFDFGEISVQIIFKDVIEIACNIPGLIDTIYEGMVEFLKDFITSEDPKAKLNNKLSLLSQTLFIFTKEKKYTIIKEIIRNLKCDTVYLLKPVALNYLSNNTNIICKLIDMAALIQNINPITNDDSPNDEPKFQVHLLDIEIWLLDIFALYVSIFNFNDEDLVKEIFTYFSKVIKKPRYNLKADEYTFHITLYRAFSIFLNRYCFHEANKTDTNIFKTLQNVIKLMPDFQKCSKEMIKSIYKVFGFVTACEEGFFSYYGTDMAKYEYLYYFSREFIYRDFCLLKYLLSLKENAEFFEFNTILRLCQVYNSFKPIEDNILKVEENKIKAPGEWLNESNKRYLKFSSKILFIILSLLRNNTSLIWNLSSIYDDLKGNKIRDNLIDDILRKDINNFLELTKELVINEILIKENLASFTDITDNIFLCLKDFFGEKNIKDLIISLTNKTLTTDKKAKFSLKDELLYYLDLNYIIYPLYKSKAEKYISDFKSKLVSIFNIHFYPVNKYELKLNLENYNRLYFNDKNFDFLFKFTSFILTQKGYEILNEYFLSVLLNYLSTFLCVESDHFVFLRENLNTDSIIKVLENNNLKDEVKKSYCQFIVKKFKEQKGVDFDENKDKINVGKEDQNDNKKNENNVQPVKKSAKMSMKEKMKNKFKKKNNDLSDKLGVDKIIVEENKKGTESCIYCLKPIEVNDITKPYGVIGDFMCDNYTSNAFFQTIKKEYKFHFDDDVNLPPFEKVYFQPLERSSIRIISCNHYIHFPCFFKKFMNSDLKSSLGIFSCPLCNRLNETYVPMVIQYTDERIKDFFKGFDVNFVFKYGKEYIEELEKKVKEEDEKKIKEKEEKEEKEKEEKEKEDLSNNEEKSEKSQKSEKNDEENYDDILDELFPLDKKEKEKEIEEEEKKEKEEDKNEEYYINEIKEINEETEQFRKTYPDLVNSCKHFVEGFVGMKAKVRDVDIEDKNIRPIIGKFSTAFAIQYRDFFCYLDNIEEKNYSISLWKNFVLSMKLMFKLDIIIKEKYFLRLFKMIQEFKTLKFEFPIKDIIQLDNVKLKTCEILLLLSILFEYKDIEGYEKYIIYMVLPIYAFGFFLRNVYFYTSFKFDQEVFLEYLKSEKMYQFLKEDETLNDIIVQVAKELVYTKVVMNKNIDADKLTYELDDNLDLLNLPSLKDKTFLEIMDELEILIESDSTNEQRKHLYENFKLNNDYKKMFQFILDEHILATNRKTCDAILAPSLFGSCIPTKFKFIELPELAIDFEYQIYNIPCEICKEIGKRALICLDCGKKVCDSRSCLAEFQEEEMPSFIAHTKICGGGRTAFLQSEDCSVLFVSNKAVFRKFVPLYVNEFGEGINKKVFGKEYKLNKEEVKRALKMFTEYSYSNAEIIT